MYFACDRKNLSRLSKESLEHVLTRYFSSEESKPSEYPNSSRGSINIADIFEHIETSDYNYYFLRCPYCRNEGLFSTGKEAIVKRGEPFVCIFCGETDPIYKVKACIEKVMTIQDLIVKLQRKNEKAHESKKLNRILLEQCLVLLSTGLEIFLRDIYCIIMNLRFVKENKSLYFKFYSDTRNDFTNFGKSISIYRRDLSIDIRSILTSDERKVMNILVNKRHLIVHNNGIVDKIFLDQTGLDLKVKDPVSIEQEEISDSIKIISKLIKKIAEYYREESFNELIKGELKDLSIPPLECPFSLENKPHSSHNST
ncbi:MAG: hypothetical protein HXS48_00115 [Theionarchaea archaeon]|nr:hypothetical protein [Theionarchaea archaeon]